MNKKAGQFILFFLVMCVSAYILVEIFREAKNPLKDVDSYRIYYRRIEENILKDMSNMDLVIVEASFFQNSNVDYLKENNTKVVGYLSLMEVGYWDRTLIDKLSDSDYLTIQDKKVLSKSGKNLIGDISEENYQNALLEMLEERIMSKGMDGVFLDTIDWIDYYKDDLEIYNKLKGGYIDFISKIKEKYPSIIVIQNRGFESFKDYSCNFIDGILWENFSSPYINNENSKIDKLKQFIKISKKKKTKVFTISFDEEMKSKDFSESMGWTHLQTQMENRYSKWNFSEN